MAQDIVERAYDQSGEVRERVEQQGNGAADTDAATGTAGTPEARRLGR